LSRINPASSIITSGQIEFSIDCIYSYWRIEPDKHHSL
jgi:hypothetical protein